jgi:hypothetical protein
MPLGEAIDSQNPTSRDWDPFQNAAQSGSELSDRQTESMESTLDLEATRHSYVNVCCLVV